MRGKIALDTATPLTRLLAETTGPDTTLYLHGLGLVTQSDGGTTEYFSADGLGSVRQLTDSTGSVLLNQTFDPYGNPYVRTGVGDTRFGFTGEQVDGNGLVYLRARYYQPEMGRFLNADPSRQERNPYQYAMSNPVLFTDPSGYIVAPGLPEGSRAPSQFSYGVTFPPIWYEGGRPRRVEFEPLAPLNPVVTGTGDRLVDQFRVPGYECWTETMGQDPVTGQEIKESHFCGLCGTVTVTSIYQTLFGSDPDASDFISIEDMVAKLVDQVMKEVADDPTMDIANLRKLAESVGLTVRMGNPANMFKNELEYFEQEIRPNLNGSSWPIILVEVNGTTGEIGKGSTWHFVAIDGLSSRQGDWKRGDEWRWVRIFNPLKNRTEYYRTVDDDDRGLEGVWPSLSASASTMWVGS